MVARLVYRMLLCKSYIITRVLNYQGICYIVVRVLKVVARVLAGLLCFVRVLYSMLLLGCWGGC